MSSLLNFLVNEKSSEIRILKSEKSEQKIQVESIRKSAVDLKRQHEEILLNSQSTVKMEEHLSFINEIKR